LKVSAKVLVAADGANSRFAKEFAGAIPVAEWKLPLDTERLCRPARIRQLSSLSCQNGLDMPGPFRGQTTSRWHRHLAECVRPQANGRTVVAIYGVVLLRKIKVRTALWSNRDSDRDRRNEIFEELKGSVSDMRHVSRGLRRRHGTLERRLERTGRCWGTPRFC